MGLLDGAADGQRGADRSGQRRQLEPVWLLRDGRRVERDDAIARAAKHIGEDAIRQPPQPESGVPRERCLGQGRRIHRRQCLRHRWLCQRASFAAGPCRHESGRAVRTGLVQGRLQPEPGCARIRANRLLSRGPAQREGHDGRAADRRDERHHLEVHERRCAREAAWFELRPGDCLRRYEDLQQQLPGDSRCDRRARGRPALAESDGAHRCVRRDGAMVARVSAAVTC